MNTRPPYSSSASSYGVTRNRGSFSSRPVAECRLEDCNHDIAPGFLYCTPKHAQEAVAKGEAEPCEQCRRFPINEGYKYCSPRCGRLANGYLSRPPAHVAGSYPATRRSFGDDDTRSSYAGSYRSRNEAGIEMTENSTRHQPMGLGEPLPSLVPGSSSYHDPSRNTNGKDEFRTFLYTPCRCEVRTKLTQPPNLDHCPICLMESRPDFVKQDGVITALNFPPVSVDVPSASPSTETSTSPSTQAPSSPTPSFQISLHGGPVSLTMEHASRPLPPPPSAPLGPRQPKVARPLSPSAPTSSRNELNTTYLTRAERPELRVPKSESIIDQDISDNEGYIAPISPTHTRSQGATFGSNLGIDARPPFSHTSSSSSAGAPQTTHQKPYNTAAPSVDPFTSEVPATPSDLSHESQMDFEDWVHLRESDPEVDRDVDMNSPLTEASELAKDWRNQRNQPPSIAGYVTVNGPGGNDLSSSYTAVEYADAEDRYPRLETDSRTSWFEDDNRSVVSAQSIRPNSGGGRQEDQSNSSPGLANHDLRPGRPQTTRLAEPPRPSARLDASSSGASPPLAPLPPLRQPASPMPPGGLAGFGASATDHRETGQREQEDRQQRYEQLLLSKPMTVPEAPVPTVNDASRNNVNSARRPPLGRPSPAPYRMPGGLPDLPSSDAIRLREVVGTRFFNLTNPSAYIVKYKEKQYPSAAHLFHAMKFIEHRPLLAEHIRWCGLNPGDQAKEFAYERRVDWSDVCIEKMKEVLKAKFTQHPRLKDELLATKPRELILDSDDTLWGVNPAGEGRNEYGKALMALREQLADQ